MLIKPTTTQIINKSKTSILFQNNIYNTNIITLYIVNNIYFVNTLATHSTTPPPPPHPQITPMGLQGICSVLIIILTGIEKHCRYAEPD